MAMLSAREIAVAFRRTHLLNVSPATAGGKDLDLACQMAEDEIVRIIEDAGRLALQSQDTTRGTG